MNWHVPCHSHSWLPLRKQRHFRARTWFTIVLSHGFKHKKIQVLSLAPVDKARKGLSLTCNCFTQQMQWHNQWVAVPTSCHHKIAMVRNNTVRLYTTRCTIYRRMLFLKKTQHRVKCLNSIKSYAKQLENNNITGLCNKK